jgi:PGF-CTERM protein
MSDRDVSVVSAVATQLGDRNVTIDARDDELLTVDGATESLSAGESTTVGDGEIFRTQDRYIVVYPGADGEVDDGDTRMEVTVVGDRLDVIVEPNRTAVDSMAGLLGSPNGNPADDIARADGTTLSRPLAFEELYGQFRDDWRVTDETTLFDYENGNGPATYYDPTYPSEPVTVDDLGDEALAEATTVAQNAGLEPGTAAYRDAVIDYALTEDRSFVTSATRTTSETDVTVDGTASETTLTAPDTTLEASEIVTGEQPLTATVDAAHPELSNVTFLVSNGTAIVAEQSIDETRSSEQTVTWNGTDVADGAYVAGVVATSESGVRNVTTEQFFVDTTAPSVGVGTNDTTVAFNYSDAVSGINASSITVEADGADVTGAAAIGTERATYDVSDLAPGESTTVEIRVVDNAGLVTTESVTVTADTDAETGGSDVSFDDDGGSDGVVPYQPDTPTTTTPETTDGPTGPTSPTAGENGTETTEQPPETPGQSPTETVTESPTPSVETPNQPAEEPGKETTTASGPGFTLLLALIALVAAGLLARRE